MILLPTIRIWFALAVLTLAHFWAFSGQAHAQASDDGDRPAAALLEDEDYFRGDTRDSLRELLEDAIDQPTEGDEAKRLKDYLDDDRKSDPFADDVEPDEEDDGSLNEDEQDDVDSQRKAANARKRAMVGHLQRLQRPMHQVKLSTADNSGGPRDRAAEVIGNQIDRFVTSSGGQPRIANRYPVCFSHRPLYFEESNLERCGQAFDRNWGCLQNGVSGFRFLTNVACLSYRLKTERPDTEVRSRGDCRVGRPFETEIPPLVDGGKNGQGLLTYAATMAGFSFLLL